MKTRASLGSVPAIRWSHFWISRQQMRLPRPCSREADENGPRYAVLFDGSEYAEEVWGRTHPHQARSRFTMLYFLMALVTSRA